MTSSSPTRVFNKSVTLIQQNDEIATILRSPHTFHGDVQGGRRNRKISSIIKQNPSTGTVEETVRFIVQGHIKDDPNEAYWSKFKRWIRPLVVEPANGVDLIHSETATEPTLAPGQQERGSWYWPSNLFKALIPPKESSLPNQTPGRSRRKPALGEYDQGEVTSTLIRVSTVHSSA